MTNPVSSLEFAMYQFIIFYSPLFVLCVIMGGWAFYRTNK